MGRQCPGSGSERLAQRGEMPWNNRPAMDSGLRVLGLDAFPTSPTVAQRSQNDETPVNTGVLKYRYRDSNPGFRRERAAS